MNALPSLSPLATTDALFFGRDGASLDRAGAERILKEALAGTDDGELFLEYRESELVSLDDGVIRSASFDTSQGFGLRAVLGDEAGYAHSDEISEASLLRAAGTVGPVRAGRRGSGGAPPPPPRGCGGGGGQPGGHPPTGAPHDRGVNLAEDRYG